jgi:hypothetical protein
MVAASVVAAAVTAVVAASGVVAAATVVAAPVAVAAPVVVVAAPVVAVVASAVAVAATAVAGPAMGVAVVTATRGIGIAAKVAAANGVRGMAAPIAGGTVGANGHHGTAAPIAVETLIAVLDRTPRTRADGRVPMTGTVRPAAAATVTGRPGPGGTSGAGVAPEVSTALAEMTRAAIGETGSAIDPGSRADRRIGRAAAGHAMVVMVRAMAVGGRGTTVAGATAPRGSGPTGTAAMRRVRATVSAGRTGRAQVGRANGQSAASRSGTGIATAIALTAAIEPLVDGLIEGTATNGTTVTAPRVVAAP